ncbi:hypothetical protein F2Q69_00046583 [Brassica cretica]|uniref:PABP n=1 Tax=Brassica cretica TaxID=69181 RepID=A0A8S9PKP5_BRACR|nr:hypothetical protein F2Q69_00046583 [Brassica cretica]
MAQIQNANGGVAVSGAAAAAVGAAQQGTTSLYVGDLDQTVTDSQLFEAFSQAGQVVSVRVCRDMTTRRSLGYGYIQNANGGVAVSGAAAAAVGAAQQGTTSLYVGDLDQTVTDSQLFEAFSQAGQVVSVRVCRDMTTRRSLGYGYNLDKSIDHKALHETFSAFGAILSCKVAVDPSGQSKGYGFVQYDTEEAAQRAIEQLNGMLLNDKQVYVGPFVHKQQRDPSGEKVKFNNVYVKNLSESMSDEELKKVFGEFGVTTSCVIMRDGEGKSKGFGFVNFESSEDAAKAIAEMNGKMIVSKPLYVALAQRKEDRKARLQAQFSQMRPVPAVGPRMPMYPPGGPPMGQQLFYGQGPPGMIPPQPGYGYQQQLVPGMRPGGAPMPNFFMPMMQQGQQQQQQQRPGGGGRRGGALPQPQQPSPMMQPQQMHPRGRMYRYPQRDVNPMPGLTPNMLSVPYDVSGGGAHLRDSPAASQPVPIGALATSLANAAPEHQRTMLGENLYPLVEQLEPESAAKVTGMLLEMDQTEVLHLLESPDALKAKVAEAMDVLRSVAQQQQAGGAADQLASLSLGDNIVP